MKKYIYILLALVGAFNWGCSAIDDDLTECEQMRVYIDFDDPDAVEWGSYMGSRTLDDSPKDARIYIFDKNDNFLGSHLITTQKVYELPYKNYDSVQYVVIVSNDIYNKIFPDFAKGQKLLKGVKFDTTFVSLLNTSPYYDVNNIAQSPVDFQIDYGFIPTIRKDNPMAPHFLYVKREVGAIRCIIIGLNKYMEGENVAQQKDPYTIMFGETRKGINYQGKKAGNWVNYVFPNYTEKNDTITTPFINALPSSTEKESEIKIFKSNYQILKKNKAKNVAIVREGRAITVIIDFNNYVAPNDGGFGVSSDKWDSVNVNANF